MEESNGSGEITMNSSFKSKLELLQSLSEEYNNNMDKIEINHLQEIKIKNAYKATLKYLAKTEVKGGCHFISVMLHILLTEQGIDNKLMIGEVEDSEAYAQFSHSWVEINGEIFDPSIMHTLDGNVHPPIYNGVKLTLQSLTMEYGISTDAGVLDTDAKLLLNKSVTAYLDEIKNWGYPKNYLWDEILKAGVGIIGYSNLTRLRKKYATHYRELKVRV